MSEPIENPYVALNNAREDARLLPCARCGQPRARGGVGHDCPGSPEHQRRAAAKLTGTVLERPTGERAALWQRYARGVEREDKAKREARKKAKESTTTHESN